MRAIEDSDPIGHSRMVSWHNARVLNELEEGLGYCVAQHGLEGVM